MNKLLNEIDDNEIRIIANNHSKLRADSEMPEEPIRPRKPRRGKYLFIIAALLILIVALIIYLLSKKTSYDFTPAIPEQPAEEQPAVVIEELPEVAVKKYTAVRDTVIGSRGLLILTPENATPRLVIGTENLNDSAIILVTQAADIRGDNGQIAGTFVLDGELISRGEAKAGYCSIINGELSIGVADATPMLEQTLTEGGYFFRQYPLVVGGQIIENKPKGRAVRKALADIGGRIRVVISTDKLTFHDFSQLLVDAGVRNAVYLVGATSYGYYITEGGERLLTGIEPPTSVENLSYIVWEK